MQHAVESLNGIYSDNATKTQFVEGLGHSNIPIRKEFHFLEKVQAKGRKKRKISIMADGGWGIILWKLCDLRARLSRYWQVCCSQDHKSSN